MMLMKMRNYILGLGVYTWPHWILNFINTNINTNKGNEELCKYSK